MLGKDFFVFWEMARGVLSGLPFYSTPEALYPPVAFFLFAPIGLLPFPIAYAIWTGLNVILFSISIRVLSTKPSHLWFFYAPTIFILMTGQIDILFLFFSVLLLSKSPNTKLLGAVLLTIKPQIAFIVLPWYLLHWLKDDRPLLIKWVLACILIHSLPLLADIHIYTKWFGVLKLYSESRLPLSPGIFSLTTYTVPMWLLGIVALGLISVGLFCRQKVSLISQLLALPMGIWYDNLFLIGTASWKILVPLSWAAFLAAYFLKSSAPFMLLPLIALMMNISTIKEDVAGQLGKRTTNILSE